MTKLSNEFFTDESGSLLLGDALKILPKISKGSVDMVFADPPYFLSNNGISCQSGKMVSVNKGSWDEGFTLQERHAFNRAWLRRCYRVLNDNGTIWVSGTLHNIYSVGMALEQENFKILNNITWQKKNPPPNLGCRCFTHSTETILWAKKNLKKSKHFFNYTLMKELNNGKQMKDVIVGALTPKKERQYGKHPTQKPEYLLERVILASTSEGALILDPFIGSGTTAVVAKKLARRFIGIDQEVEYLKLAENRIRGVKSDA